MTDRPRSFPVRLLRWAVGSVVLAIGLALGALFTYAYVTAPGSDIEPWHSYVPAELDAAAIDASDWPGYIAAENRVRAEVVANVSARIAADDRQRFNRFNPESPINPQRFVQDWNRSYVLEPVGPAQGVVVLVHGLTDAPYSLRHVAELYQSRGWIAIGLRVPGHGTVPGALTKATWQQWAAATRLAMREARRRAGAGKPIDLVGYSNGGALAVNYQIEALDNPALASARRIILFSPMIGLTEFARFAGVAGWPAIVPAFAHSAWMGIVPEFNPYKYNSFPVNAAVQSYQLTDALQTATNAAVASGAFKRMPPILAFQSVADSTVSTAAIITRLYDRLPANGSELVLFDINRSAGLDPLLRASASAPLSTLVPPRARNWRLTVITNPPDSAEAYEVSTLPSTTAAIRRDIGQAFPADVFSLTHIAIPFPASDGLYGNAPNPADDTGINLGGLAARGERGVLSIGLDTLLRLSWNPFYDYMMERIDQGVPVPVG